jgi:hypothetical protein
MALAMLVNSAAVLRALGDRTQAQDRDEHAWTELRRRLGDDHPYTLCAHHNFATDLALLGYEGRAHDEFKSLSANRSRGDAHPDTLAATVNRVLARQLVGGRQSADGELTAAIVALEESLGAQHPQVRAARAREWLECDIEPPPT